MEGVVVRPRKSGALYTFLLAGQTLAASALFWIMFPVFYQVVTHLGQRQTLTFAQYIAIIGSTAVLHGCYWTRLTCVEITPPLHNVFVAHLFSFASRVSFFFGGALFSVLFFRHLPELDVLPSWDQIALNLLYFTAVLFGLFCYSLELERLAKAIEPPIDTI